MTATVDTIDDAFGPVLKLPCWGVKGGYGSFLTIEFGEPSLRIREPRLPSEDTSSTVRRMLSKRLVTVRGQWHLWIYCCDWQVLSGGAIVGDSSSKESVDEASAVLDGQRLIEVCRGRGPATWQFSFDLGATLRTRPYDGNSEQWFLYEPSGLVLHATATGHVVRQLGSECHSGSAQQQDEPDR